MGRASVSVIIPYYNSSITIGRAVQSIAEQTLLPEEVIIINDCSSDPKTNDVLEDIVKKYEAYFKIILLETIKNSGPGTARNIGWDRAKGEYIAFLDSDDAWLHKKIEIQYNFMKENDTIKFSCTKILVGGEKDINSDEIRFLYINKWKSLFFHNSTGTPTVMIKRNIPLRFEEGKRYAEDYLLFLKILFHYEGVVVDASLCRCFKNLYGESGLSKDLWEIEKGELQCFYELFRSKYIPLWLLLLSLFFSYIKYLRREILVKSRRWLRKIWMSI